MKRQILANRRVRPRIDVLLNADFEINDNELPEHECLITNLSVSGAGLVFSRLAEGAVSKGLIITLEFSIPGEDQHTYVQGEIAWVEHLEDKIAAGVNFSEPLSFEEIMKCCVDNKHKFENN